MLMAMDAQGRPLWTRRIGASRASLQPALLPLSSTEIHALMRDHGAARRIQRATSHDAGRSWHDQAPLDLINDDNSLAALALVQGGHVMVRNDALPAPAGARQWLRLSTSSDALRWHGDQDVRRGSAGEEFSYPSLLQVGRQLHVTFTAQRGAIGHHVYDVAAPGAP
jgi:predicted neuraminidase